MNLRGQKPRRPTFRDEEGVTTAGMALSMLVCLALVFSTGRVYRVASKASEVQYVADAAALAAENEVAEYMIVARVCDAVSLSLSLASLTATGLGVVALCTPASAPFSEKLLSVGRDLANARDSFARAAATGLDRLQRALPFLAAANAAAVARANNAGGSSYLAVAILAPLEGTPISAAGSEEARAAQERADNEAAELGEAAAQAEEAARSANEAKQRAFERDCGDNPSFCMYERASTLASLTGSENPLFTSVDAWSFGVALQRAQAYYERRLSLERPADSSAEEGARSALRARFYRYASEEVGRGYVRETADSFEAWFPRLPRNTAEMRETPLYVETTYPLTTGDEGSVLHAWEGCPEAAGWERYASIAEMETGSWRECASCGFTAASLGKVAAASTSIENGFEYHYDAVAQAAEDYVRARQEMEPASSRAKDLAGGVLGQLGDAFGAAARARISVDPPGALGVVVLVADTGSMPSSRGFESLFVNEGDALGARVALSAATLVADPSEEGTGVVSSLLDGVAAQGGAAVGAAAIALECWTRLLRAHADGQRAFEDAVAGGLERLPLIGSSGLGSWAAKALRDAAARAGLQPAELDALKPVLVNSAHVARAEGGAFGARLVAVKRQVIAYPLAMGDPFSSIVGSLEQGAIDAVREIGPLRVATVELFGGVVSVPIEVTLPPAAQDVAVRGIEWMADALRGLELGVVRVRVWE